MKKVTIFSGRALEEELNKIHTVLNNDKADWKQRMEALSMVRAWIVAGAGQFDELSNCLKSLEYPFESCVKDLRSQVCWQVCHCSSLNYSLGCQRMLYYSGLHVTDPQPQGMDSKII